MKLQSEWQASKTLRRSEESDSWFFFFIAIFTSKSFRGLVSSYTYRDIIEKAGSVKHLLRGIHTTANFFNCFFLNQQKGYLVILKEYSQDVYDVQGQPLNRCIGHGELTVGSSDGDGLWTSVTVN